MIIDAILQPVVGYLCVPRLRAFLRPQCPTLPRSAKQDLSFPVSSRCMSEYLLCVYRNILRRPHRLPPLHHPRHLRCLHFLRSRRLLHYHRTRSCRPRTRQAEPLSLVISAYSHWLQKTWSCFLYRGPEPPLLMSCLSISSEGCYVVIIVRHFQVFIPSFQYS